MDKGEFTPGPWTIPVPWSGFSEIRGGNDELVFGLAAGCEGEKQPDETCKANAHLIAAAPDMFAALIEARDFIRDEGNETAHAFADKLDAVISKARGDS